MRLRDAKVVVTGAASGLGLEVHRRMVAEGAHVYGGDIDADRMSAVADDVGGNWSGVDVTRPEQVETFVATAERQLGGIDVLVHCAGLNRPADFLDQTLDEWNLIVSTNLTSSFLVGQAVARRMRDAGTAGSIIMMSSIHAVVARSDNAAYAATKGGVTQLTKSMAGSLGPHGIRVNAIGPGPCETDLTAARMTTEEGRSGLMRGIVLGRLGRPEDVASLAVFLASEDSAWMTGTTVYVDGGILSSR
jgi:glucose 1-dehydrogenase